MHSTLFKKTFLFASLFLIVTLACDLSVTIAPTADPTPQPVNTLMPATGVPADTSIPVTVEANVSPTAIQASFEGVEVTVDPLRIVLSSTLASGARGTLFPRAEGDGVAPFDITPGHTLLKLEGYVLQGKFHEPEIYVYPAQGYAEMVPAAFESMHRLNNILFDPAAPVSEEQLPRVPFFNAAQVFASNIRVISFQNGQGVRFLTEYAQYAAPVNNHELFYHFQGLTNDGAYFVIAILPVTAPLLAENSDAAAALTPGGVAYPDITDPNADWQGYYSAVTALLDATSPEAFTPTIHQLDALIQSMRVTP